MPTRLHRPANHKPPSTIDHILAHPWEFFAIGGMWATLGALLCWSWIDPGGGPSTVLQTMQPWVAAGVAIALLLAGLALMTAIVWPGKDSTAWFLELYALPFGVVAWASYAVVAPSPFWLAICLGQVFSGMTRWWVALRNARKPQQALMLVPVAPPKGRAS